MRHSHPRAGAWIAWAAILALPAAAASDRIRLRDGKALHGKVINATQSLFVIKLDSGETRPIPRGRVAECLFDRATPPPAGRAGDASFEAREVVFLPRAEYLKLLLEELRRARRSISVVMYQMSMAFTERNEPFRIARALIDAANRGVDVRVLFEDPGCGYILDCNTEAAAYLAGNGVRVKFDDPERVTHAKLVLIDGFTSILGSHNWSSSGLRTNSESSVLVRSGDVAAEFGRLFDEIWSSGNCVAGPAERRRREARRMGK